MGLAGYYYRLVKNFSSIAKPLTKFTQKVQNFCLKNLKERLIIAPILALPKEGKKFIVYADASHSGLGCVLMQGDKVVSYASR